MFSNSSGVIQIHSAPKALTSHVEWAISGVLGSPVHLRWEQQPVAPAMLCVAQKWAGPAGSAARIASALFGWRELRFEISEDATAPNDGTHFMHTPTLGIHRVHVDATGSTYITEARLQRLCDESGDSMAAFRESVAQELGRAWDDELDVFRARIMDRSVTWLHSVG